MKSILKIEDSNIANRFWSWPGRREGPVSDVEEILFSKIYSVFSNVRV
jgi:hypothetical protein